MDDDILVGVAEDWQIVLRVLPSGWPDKARELRALRRYREFPDAATLLRVLLIHLAEGCSLRETVVWAAEGQLVTVLDVALLKRLRVSGEWFRWMGEELMRRWLTARPVRPLLDAGLRLRIATARRSANRERRGRPGDCITRWGCLRWPARRSMSPRRRWENRCVGFRLRQETCSLPTRGYATRNGVRHVHQHGGAVIVRLNLTNLPLTDGEGNPLALLPQL